jgi:hypothetical protein
MAPGSFASEKWMINNVSDGVMVRRIHAAFFLVEIALLVVRK